MLLTIISFLFVFTVITLVHEFGHLYFSKKAGIRVHEFGLGFGPTLFSFKKNNTTYKINLLPILGYVKIAGIDVEDPQEKETPENEKYFNKSPFDKFKSISSGAIMNLIFGFIIFSLVFMISGSPVGISNEISTITPGSPAAKIGMQAGDRLISINGKVYEDPQDAVKFIHKNYDKKITLKIKRSEKFLTLKAIPKYNKRLKIGLLGFSLKAVTEKVNPLQAIWMGLKQTASLILLILVLVGKLFSGRLALGDLAGPVGIAQITGQFAHQGPISLLYFIAFFSVNVAVLNLLPIPALDGGRLVFVLIEAIRKKPINIESENKVHSIGMILLLSLLAMLTFNDIFRIFFKN
ncbi:MAG: RIP metalloprotease RseP [Candidatus Margulisiibacteriota bacterium]|nr:RIP metalloprotease RseP [Candidatus Margulisiibacteriota bacterium]